MEAEDIIQQKEWQQLSSTEREIVGALAATEAEYNLLKKMLMVSQEELEEVPVLDPRIKMNVTRELNKESKKSVSVWYYAAAALIVIAMATFFILKKEPAGPDLVITPLPNQAVPSPVIDTTVTMPRLQNNNVAVNPSPGKKMVPKKSTQADKPINKDIPLNDLDQSSYAKVEITVGEDMGLLALVTEVY